MNKKVWNLQRLRERAYDADNLGLCEPGSSRAGHPMFYEIVEEQVNNLIESAQRVIETSKPLPLPYESRAALEQLEQAVMDAQVEQLFRGMEER